MVNVREELRIILMGCAKCWENVSFLEKSDNLGDLNLILQLLEKGLICYVNNCKNSSFHQPSRSPNPTINIFRVS